MQQVLPMNAEREFAFSEKEFRFLAKLAYDKTGIVLAEHKEGMVYGRLVRRLRTLNLASFADYCKLLDSEKAADEIGHLVDALTTNLTSFFRENHHFEHLRDEVLAPLAGKKHRLRIWSSACSSGMEPYSIAMVMAETLPDIAKRDALVLATDIDTNMLATGNAGVYSQSDTKNIPGSYKKHWMPEAKTGNIVINEEIRRLIRFRRLNLLESWPMKGKFDAVFCRNVVIYFDKPTKQKLFDRMADMLVPGGWLYIGHSENLHNITDRFEIAGRTIYRRIK